MFTDVVTAAATWELNSTNPNLHCTALHCTALLDILVPVLRQAGNLLTRHSWSLKFTIFLHLFWAQLLVSTSSGRHQVLTDLQMEMSNEIKHKSWNTDSQLIPSLISTASPSSLPPPASSPPHATTPGSLARVLQVASCCHQPNQWSLLEVWHTIKGTVPWFFFFHNKSAFGEYIHVHSAVLKVWFVKCSQITMFTLEISPLSHKNVYAMGN